MSILAVQTNFPSLGFQMSIKKKEYGVEKASDLSDNGADSKSNAYTAEIMVSGKIRSRINALNQASRNVQHEISITQATEADMNETHKILGKIRELAVKAADENNSEADKKIIDEKVSQLINKLFDTTKRISGKSARDANVNEDAYNKLSGSDSSNHEEVIGIVDETIDEVSVQREKLTTRMGGLLLAEKRIGLDAKKLSGSNLHITDMNSAKEMMKYTRSSILSDTESSIFAQANQNSSRVLSLIGRH